MKGFSFDAVQDMPTTLPATDTCRRRQTDRQTDRHRKTDREKEKDRDTQRQRGMRQEIHTFVLTLVHSCVHAYIPINTIKKKGAQEGQRHRYTHTHTHTNTHTHTHRLCMYVNKRWWERVAYLPQFLEEKILQEKS